MSVYTAINKTQLEELLSHYTLGALISYAGIQAGIENSNFRVKTTQGNYIVTIYEILSSEELPDYFALLNHLGQQHFPAPKPQATQSGQFLHYHHDKPIAIFDCLPGQSIDLPNISECAEIGHYLAKLHLSTRDCHFNKNNHKDLHGCQTLFHSIKSKLTYADQDLIQSELNYQAYMYTPDLTQGIIHADLFKDNVLFEQGHISGIVDFYNACKDSFIFDIAITINDWCLEQNQINQNKMNALLTAYNQRRTLSKHEKTHLPSSLRLAALRFWLSRLEHQLNPRAGELTLNKDPLVFRRLLEYHRAS